MSATKQEWDHKHGLPGRRSGTNFGDSAQGQTEHGSASLGLKQVLERARELFGKQSDNETTRLKGLPTHAQQLQDLLRNLDRDVTSGAANAEQEVKRALYSALSQVTNVRVPTIGFVFKSSGEVMVYNRLKGRAVMYGVKFEPSEFNTQLNYWRLAGNALGDYHQCYPEYAGWPAFQANNAGGTNVVKSFFDGHLTLP